VIVCIVGRVSPATAFDALAKTAATATIERADRRVTMEGLRRFGSSTLAG
jgi:hypothetical protein